MTDLARYTSREAREDAIYERAANRAKSMEQYWQSIRDAAAIIKSACAELIAEDARAGVVHTGPKYQQVGTDETGRPVFGIRPGIIVTMIDEIAGAVDGLDTIDTRKTSDAQRDAWAEEDLEANGL